MVAVSPLPQCVKWLFKLENTSDEDLLCNMVSLLDYGRYEGKTRNEKIVKRRGKALQEVRFKYAVFEDDDAKTKDVLRKGYGKDELIVDQYWQRKIIQKYSKLGTIEEYQRPFIVTTQPELKTLLWGDAAKGSGKRVKELILRFNRESLEIKSEERAELLDGYITLSASDHNIRTYLIQTLEVKVKTSKGMRKATGYKVSVAPEYLKALLSRSHHIVLEDGVFTKLKKCSFREIKLALKAFRYWEMQDSYVPVNDELLHLLDINTQAKKYHILRDIKKACENVSNKIPHFDLVYDPISSKIYIEKPRLLN